MPLKHRPYGHPLHPSVKLLRKIVRELASCEDPDIREWVDEMTRHFSSVTLVKSYRYGRLCGYDVWRHLKSSMDDPKRRKARLWFGLRPKGDAVAEAEVRERAQRAKEWMETLSERDLNIWWEAEQRKRHGRIRGVHADKRGGVVAAWEAKRIIERKMICVRFPVARWRARLGYEGAAQEMAEKTARMLHDMTKEEARAWWAARQYRPAINLQEVRAMAEQLGRQRPASSEGGARTAKRYAVNWPDERPHHGPTTLQ